MKLKNQILNYFVVPPDRSGQMPRVFLSPVTMRDDVGRKIIEEQLSKSKDSIPAKRMLHVCFDRDSERIYIPNAAEFPKEQMEMLLKAAQIKITKDFGGFMGYHPIEGSPFSSIRVRSVSSFGHTLNAIHDHFEGKDFVDLPVIEANLARMPTTIKNLPEIYRTNEKYVGGYIGPEFAKSIPFYDEKELSGAFRKQKIPLINQPTPFILINITPSVEAGASEKEWAVLSGYRDFLYSQNENKEVDPQKSQEFNSFADLYAYKRYMYLGWPFEEVCQAALEHVSNFGELINAIDILVEAANSLESEGYPNPAANPYYMTFKIDLSLFPLSLESMMQDGQFSPFRQLENFRIIEYDTESKFLIIETPAFISPNLCHRLLKSKNRPLIVRYNPIVNTIDVKSTEGTFTEYQIERMQKAKINALVNHDLKRDVPPEEQNEIEYPKFRDDDRSRGISLANPNTCHIRKVSNYFYAMDHIKKVCEKNNMEFKDVDVVIGPIERIFGRGTQGGFMGPKQFEANKLEIPYELEKGLFVSPPVITVNSVHMPSYAAQTTTLIHEYCHNLYSITNPEHEHLYNKDPKLKKQDELAWWDLYFNDEDERIAHIEEIKHELISGRSTDEIIRDKIGEARGQVGGAITLNTYKVNYPIALKFRELVMEAVRQLEEENELNEKPIGAEAKLGRNNITTS